MICPARQSPVRVCFLIDRLSRAGTELQLLSLIRGLDRTKVEPYLCLLDGDDAVSRSLEPSSCPVLRLGVRVLKRPSTVVGAWRFARFLRRERIDVLQVIFSDSTNFGVPVGRLAGVRRIIRTRRNLGYWMKPVDRWVGRLMSRLVDATLVNCEACRRAVIEQERARPESVVVIENGIDLAPFRSIRPFGEEGDGSQKSGVRSPESGVGNKAWLTSAPHFSTLTPQASSLTPQASLRRVGMVANLRPVKGPDVFVRAAALVAAEHPNVRFLIAGTGDEAWVRQVARECGLHCWGGSSTAAPTDRSTAAPTDRSTAAPTEYNVDDRLDLLGRVDDVPAFLATLDVAVLASRSEGLSNALLEYMAAGRPIVATAVGGNVELIEDGVTGLLVPPEDPTAMAAAIGRLLCEPEFAASLGRAARGTAEERFSAAAVAKRYESYIIQTAIRTLVNAR